MRDPRDISISDFDYSLPDDRIARYPLPERDQSRLLVWKGGEITDDRFANAAAHVPPEALLVFNETRVIRARLLFRTAKGASVEVFCLEPEPGRHTRNDNAGSARWNCLVGRLKSWKQDTLHLDGAGVRLSAEVAEKTKDRVTVEFHWLPVEMSFEEVLERCGSTPVPPYLGRQAEDVDRERYQTVYARLPGSVAAPTAGLHFTTPVLKQLERRGAKVAYLTLHVGSGTFKPVKSAGLVDHEMHGEWFTVTSQLVESLIDSRKVIAVGTTSLRALESLYWLGVRAGSLSAEDDLQVAQWEPYGTGADIPAHTALRDLLSFMSANNMKELSCRTSILLAPPYRFRVIQGLFTNFHQPRSTLLLLVAAFTGNDWRRIYDHALSGSYRFLSYGDSSLLLP